VCVCVCVAAALHTVQKRNVSAIDRVRSDIIRTFIS